MTLAVVFFFFSGCRILNYLYWQDYDWGRILWHNYYGREDNIDRVYLGSSHVYCDLNPEILDSRNGKNNFNLSTGSQRLIESYYILKEADRGNRIETVYLELYYVPSTGAPGNYQDKTSVQGSWRLMNYMEPSLYKVEAICGLNPMQFYPEAFFPFIRYREHLMDGEWIKSQTAHKRDEDYKNYTYNDGSVEYRDKGYYYSESELTNLLYERDRRSEEMFMTEDAEGYLRKIIEYCQEKNISVVLFCSPVYEIQLMATENYDSYVDGIRETAAQYGVPYYDFNLAKEEYLPIQYPEYFMDVGHLNAKGAKIYTDFFWRTVSAPQGESADYFYGSYREKLEKSGPRVYGIYCYNEEGSDLQEGYEPGKTRRMVIASNREEKLEYRVTLTTEEGDTNILQEFSKNKRFYISSEEHGICEIAWRDADGGIEKLEIKY